MLRPVDLRVDLRDLFGKPLQAQGAGRIEPLGRDLCLRNMQLRGGFCRMVIVGHCLLRLVRCELLCELLWWQLVLRQRLLARLLCRAERPCCWSCWS